MESLKLDKQICQKLDNSIVLAMGANISGAWGEPDASLRYAAAQMLHYGLIIEKLSPVYRTKPHSQIRQHPFLNIVLLVRGNHSPVELLQIFKRLERAAGRRHVGRNGPRPLDIDLIDYFGRTINWRGSIVRPKLVLPHPLIAERPFVLAPLIDVWPHWRHPVSKLTANQMLRELGGLKQLVRQGEIKKLDSPLFPCDL
jgi:2-amino-4-hydroxy-6-hydroxymethyldihydropteridine diphosphokinase